VSIPQTNCSRGAYRWNPTGKPTQVAYVPRGAAQSASRISNPGTSLPSPSLRYRCKADSRRRTKRWHVSSAQVNKPTIPLRSVLPLVAQVQWPQVGFSIHMRAGEKYRHNSHRWSIIAGLSLLGASVCASRTAIFRAVRGRTHNPAYCSLVRRRSGENRCGCKNPAVALFFVVQVQSLFPTIARSGKSAHMTLPHPSRNGRRVSARVDDFGKSTLTVPLRRHYTDWT
jgi:hypothetical protein